MDVVVIYLGLDEVTEAEGLDRTNLHIEQNQLDLVKDVKALGKDVVVVLSCGSAIEIPFMDEVDALLHCYLNGQAGAQAALNILSGDVNPSGKLSETYPIKLEDVASSDNFPSHTRTIEYREAYGIGYRYFEKADVLVRFPFGFGLSYTTFEYSNLEIKADGVSFDITNTGERDGKEIAQLYVGLEASEIINAEESHYIRFSLEVTSSTYSASGGAQCFTYSNMNQWSTNITAEVSIKSGTLITGEDSLTKLTVKTIRSRIVTSTREWGEAKSHTAEGYTFAHSNNVWDDADYAAVGIPEVIKTNA